MPLLTTHIVVPSVAIPSGIAFVLASLNEELAINDPLVTPAALLKRYTVSVPLSTIQMSVPWVAMPVGCLSCAADQDPNDLTLASAT